MKKSKPVSKTYKKNKTEENLLTTDIPHAKFIKPVKVPSASALAKKQYYVDPKEFEEEIRVYYETNNISDKLATMIKNIAYGLAHASNFINYTFKEDAIGDSLINMFKALSEKKFKFEKNKNPFSYFNAISFNCWRSRIKKEKTFRDTLASYQEEVYSIIGPGVGVDDPVNHGKESQHEVFQEVGDI